MLFGLLVIIAILAMFICALKIGEQMASDEQKLVVYGAIFLLTFQSFLNIGCTVGALPTTGKPLPFVSSGGTSVIASFILLGLILNAVNGEPVKTTADRRRDRLEVVTSKRFDQSVERRSSFSDRSTSRKPQSSRSFTSRASDLDFVSSFDSKGRSRRR